MARRQLLTDEQWARLLAPPSDEREIVRYWTLSREDFDIIFRKRSDHSRLGFALLLCYLRYPGRVLGAEEVPPVALVSFVARQLGVSPAAFIRYSRRDQTRREQLVELMERLSYRSFERASFLHYLAWLTPIAQNVQRPDLLVEMLLEDLRRHRVLIPTLRMLELLLHQARSRAERLVYRALTNRLTDTQGDALDTLLNQKPEAAISWMGWLRQLPQAPTARNILALIERLRFVRELGIDADRQRSVSVSAFERLATDCLRTTVQHIRELALPRRRAMLVAAVIRLESAVTDATLFMFDKLLGSMSRKAERQTVDKSFQTLREVQGHLRTLTAACRAMIQARESTADPVAAVEQRVGWEKFVQCVAEAESLAQPETTDIRAELITKYPTIRCFAGAFLEVFEFRGGGAVSNLLKALALISEMYRAGKRTLPLKPPTAFIRRAWRPFVFKDGDIDRRAYELCVFSELRNRLRAGDVWVDRSRQYQDFETYLIPKLTFEILKAEGPLPVEIETEVQSYLESRRSALTQELTTVATLAESGKLPDVDLAEGDLKITPLRAVTPPEAESLRDAAYDLLPRIKITDLLLEVDRWTGFSECFTHQRNGQPAENKAALLTTILADGINLGLSRMAEACRGATLRQLAWVHDWHIREETYAAALSQLINAHRTIPLAELWGTGTTSSSDGQYFRAGGRGEKLADINARHGNEPGVTFYTHLSDQFGPYYTKVIAATASEAPHVLDGLLYHQTGLQIEEHYTDTGGATDHVFGLCHLFGFRFAPRIRDLKDRRLYLFPGQTPQPILDPLVGGFVDVHQRDVSLNSVLPKHGSK